MMDRYGLPIVINPGTFYRKNKKIRNMHVHIWCRIHNLSHQTNYFYMQLGVKITNFATCLSPYFFPLKKKPPHADKCRVFRCSIYFSFLLFHYSVTSVHSLFTGFDAPTEEHLQRRLILVQITIVQCFPIRASVSLNRNIIRKGI